MAFSSHIRPVVSIVARPGTGSVWVRLVGDVEMAAEPALAEAADRLHGLALHAIVIDLTAVRFVCSTLANFLATLHRAHPDAELVLHHPSPMARMIVTATGLDAFVGMGSSDPAPPASAARPITATSPLNTRYPGHDPSTPRSRPGRWVAIDRQRGRGLDGR